VWWSKRRLWRRCSSAASEWAAPCHGCRHQWVGHHRQHRLVIIAQESSLRFRRLQVKGRVAEDQVQTLITAPPFVHKQAAGPANVLCFQAAAHNGHRDSLIQRRPAHLAASPSGSGSDQTSTQRAEVGLSDSNVHCAMFNKQNTAYRGSPEEAILRKRQFSGENENWLCNCKQQSSQEECAVHGKFCKSST